MTRIYIDKSTTENAESILESAPPSRGIKLLEVNRIREQEVKRYLEKVKSNKPTGPDKSPSRLLKELRQQLLQPLLAFITD